MNQFENEAHPIKSTKVVIRPLSIEMNMWYYTSNQITKASDEIQRVGTGQDKIGSFHVHRLGIQMCSILNVWWS